MSDSYPVKYMVRSAWFGWKVIDTTWVIPRTVKRFFTQYGAHRSAAMLNRQEGYRYVY
jgi:hypothetical protein